MKIARRIPFAQAPHFMGPTVAGHAGDLLFGHIEGIPVVVMQGRFHYYEGHSMAQVTLPVRVFKAMGAEMLIIVSASGGLDLSFRSGEIMLIEDHINFMGDSPLRGLTDSRLGDRFPDMSRPYDPQLMEFAQAAAREANVRLHSGVYAAVSGPNLETRAETRMLKLLGASAVGMSTVPEVITAAQVGLRALGFAVITNVNDPEAMAPLALEMVVANAQMAEVAVSAVVSGVFRRLNAP